MTKDAAEEIRGTIRRKCEKRITTPRPSFKGGGGRVAGVVARPPPIPYLPNHPPPTHPQALLFRGAGDVVLLLTLTLPSAHNPNYWSREVGQEGER